MFVCVLYLFKKWNVTKMTRTTMDESGHIIVATVVDEHNIC